MTHADILIAEDDKALREALGETLEMAGYQVMTAENGADALNLLKQCPVRMVVSDVQMERLDGLGLLQSVRSLYREVPVLLMTAYGTIEKAVQAMQAGACDYLVKPVDADALIRYVRKYLASDSAASDAPVVQDGTMDKVLRLAARVARSDATVLIQGESGTGKEVIARYIHDNSARARSGFVAINCAAIPDNMLEAVLFGYEKGAFTGAYRTTAGKFELAQGGTLLLDEISEMELGLQAKLLRVLQEKEVERLGGKGLIELNVRVLATTNRNLKQEVAEGRFREDLYYRLNVFPLRLPPLRERRQDILPLAREFIRRYSESGKPLPELDEEARRMLGSHHWPGNVRELENVIQRALILRMGERITGHDLAFEDSMLDHDERSADAMPGEMPGRLGEGLRSMEERIILDTLIEERGSRKLTADRLGISPRTLRYKIARMREAGIPVPC